MFQRSSSSERVYTKKEVFLYEKAFHLRFSWVYYFYIFTFEKSK